MHFGMQTSRMLNYSTACMQIYRARVRCIHKPPALQKAVVSDIAIFVLKRDVKPRLHDTAGFKLQLTTVTTEGGPVAISRRDASIACMTR